MLAGKLTKSGARARETLEEELAKESRIQHFGVMRFDLHIQKILKFDMFVPTVPMSCSPSS